MTPYENEYAFPRRVLRYEWYEVDCRQRITDVGMGHASQVMLKGEELLRP
jgi:hypothetical protein